MSKSIKLTKDPIWTLLRKVTIPASVGSLFQTFYNLVDTWFAGRISAEAIGAIAKSFPIYFTIIAVGVGNQYQLKIKNLKNMKRELLVQIVLINLQKIKNLVS